MCVCNAMSLDDRIHSLHWTCIHKFWDQSIFSLSSKSQVNVHPHKYDRSHISFNSIPKSVLLLSNGVKAAKHWLRSASLAVNLQNSHRARTREKSGRKCRKLGKDHKDSKLCRYETHVVSHFIDLNMTRKLGQGKNFNVLSANEKCEDGRSWQGNYAQWSFTSPI